MKLREEQFEMTGGISPLALIDEYGGPLYVYDAAKIKSQYLKLKEGFKGVKHLKISFACKALTNIHIMSYMRSLGISVDCVSIEELMLAEHAGYDTSTLIYTPSGVSEQELDQAVALGAKINIDSIDGLVYLGKKHPGYPVNIRIKPNIMAGGNIKISVGHEGAKFGIPLSSMDQVHAVVKKYQIKITGIHIHTGSDILDYQVFEGGAKVVFDVAKDFPDLEFIDFGGGFKVPYKEGDKAVDISVLGPRISALFNDFCTDYGRDLQLIFEPGKFLVSECGYFLTPVNVIKDGGGITFVHVDSGLNHLIRPMFYDAYHHIYNCSNPSAALQTYDVVGYICETDTFASSRSIPEVRAGDVLAFCNTGAYCFSMASNYNSRVRPAEIMLINGGHRLIRRRETFDDLLSTQINL